MVWKWEEPLEVDEVGQTLNLEPSSQMTECPSLPTRTHTTSAPWATVRAAGIGSHSAQSCSVAGSNVVGFQQTPLGALRLLAMTWYCSQGGFVCTEAVCFNGNNC